MITLPRGDRCRQLAANPLGIHKPVNIGYSDRKSQIHRIAREIDLGEYYRYVDNIAYDSSNAGGDHEERRRAHDTYSIMIQLSSR